MSTLSELIPSGGTQNNIEFVAQGTLANGQTVALRSDGKVEAVGESSISENMGAIAEYADGTVGYLSVAFNVADGKYVFAYIDFAVSGKLYAVVGTPSGTDITFGTPLEISGAGSYGYLQAVYDASAQKVVLGSNNSSGYFQVVVLTISGTSLTKGTAAIPFSTSSSYVCGVYHEAEQKCVFINMFSPLNNTKVHIATVSGTGVTINSSTNVPNETTIEYLAATYVNTTTPRVLFIGKSISNSNYTRGITFTVSGTTPTFNSNSANIDTNTNAGSSCVYNSQAERAICFFAVGSTIYGISLEMNASGDLVSLGTKKTISSGSPNYSLSSNGSVYDPLGYLTYVTYYAGAAVNRLELIKISYSSNTLTIEGGSGISTSGTYVGIGYDSTNKQIGVSFKNGNDGDDGYGRVYTIAGTSTNASSFIGITNAAISSSATGEVAVKGGLSTTADLGTFTPSFSTPVRYTTSNSAAPACSVCYDTTNDRYVMFYTDSTNSNYGYATVGTYSSGTTTWGTPVAVNSVNSSNVKAVFDASQGKVLFVYTNGSDSSKLVSVVGTVSGTSISVGSAVTMSASLTSTGNTSVTYDANVNRSLVLTKVGSDSSKVYASVVSISGTTPTFNGTAVLTGTLATTQNIASCFDPDTNKVAAFVYDANASTTSGYVVTVSASSFSTSAGLNIGIGEALGMLSEYSTVANQVLVFVKPSAVTASQARTFTVAATLSASSDWVNVTSSATASTLAIAEDVSKSVVVLAGQDEISGAQGKVSLATISGASLTVTTATVFQASAANPATAVYNPDSSNVLIGYRDGSTYGTSAIVSVTSDTLTIGSNYFVQDDGSIATTSSSTKAGKAISTTALNLVDPT